jgi:16S rRNA (cytosine967-C5)-methyltransferase
VTAVDRAATRLQRLRENLARCQLTAEVVEADGTKFKPDQKFDGVLIDAPCSSTGTIRRHPDVAWSKQPDDITALSGLQDRLIEAGLDLVAPGGQLIFSTCSLQSAEGIERIERILERKPQWVRAPIRPDELFGLNELITPQGDLRALPNHLRSLGGLDGFFAARLVRVS